MGRKADAVRRSTRRRIRREPLSTEERQLLRTARYEGSPLHKRNPGDFGLTPPAAPRPDKTLCDEAGITSKAEASRLFQIGIRRELVSEESVDGGFPKEIWIVDENGRVFEAMYGGSVRGTYHGHPVRRSDPVFEQITRAWNDG